MLRAQGAEAGSGPAWQTVRAKKRHKGRQAEGQRRKRVAKAEGRVGDPTRQAAGAAGRSSAQPRAARLLCTCEGERHPP